MGAAFISLYPLFNLRIVFILMYTSFSFGSGKAITQEFLRFTREFVSCSTSLWCHLVII